jgi:hypothetical protein
MHRLHGRGRRRAAEAQRVPHEAAGRRRSCPSKSGSRTLKDALNEALRDWVANVEDTFYCIGTVAGPHPYPAMVRDFQSVIGRETREQMLEREGRLPDSLSPPSAAAPTPWACSIPSSTTRSVEIIGVEAAGTARDRTKHAASLTGGKPGVLHGNRTYLLMDDDGQITEAIRSRRASIIPASAPSIPGCTTWRVNMSRHRQGSARSLPALLRSSKASSPRSSPRMRWPM